MTARLERLREGMREAKLDALICRLPENVLYLTDYWAQLGLSMAVITREGGPILFVPEVEADYADKSWADVRPFGWGLLKDRDLYTTFKEGLLEVRDKLDLAKATIGIEQGFEVMAPPYNVGELCVPATPTMAIFREVFSEGELKDSTEVLQGMRAFKTPFEIERLKVTNELASFGLAAFVENAAPGKTEAQVGAAVEEVVRSLGQGYKGVRLARAIAEVRAGVGSYHASLWVASRDYRIREGDIVMIELAVVADGYWSDLTRVVIAGEPTKKQREVYTVVLEAQKAAIEKMRPGVIFSEVDNAARQVIERAGYGQHFVHITGHGIGFRYHEFIPLLAPQAKGKLAAGMASSVEPGIYIPDWGGIRIEDNIVVTEDEPEYLSTFDRTF
jgi:Xaa-Pro aminopeptidase